MENDIETLSFSKKVDFRNWLKINYNRQEGIYVRFEKKNSKLKSINHKEALDEALCFGWIDGVGKSIDDTSWKVKFTPRRLKSLWSKKNIENVERLIKSGLMTIHGQSEIDRAKKDGRWEKAYDSPSNMTVPDDLLLELGKDKSALKFFQSLNKANLYAISWRLQTAKTEKTRSIRMKKILEMLGKGEKFH